MSENLNTLLVMTTSLNIEKYFKNHFGIFKTKVLKVNNVSKQTYNINYEFEKASITLNLNTDKLNIIISYSGDSDISVKPNKVNINFSFENINFINNKKAITLYANFYKLEDLTKPIVVKTAIVKREKNKIINLIKGFIQENNIYFKDEINICFKDRLEFTV